MLLNIFTSVYDNSEEYLPLHEGFIGHNTLPYLEEEDELSSEDVKKI